MMLLQCSILQKELLLLSPSTARGFAAQHSLSWSTPPALQPRLASCRRRAVRQRQFHRRSTLTQCPRLPSTMAMSLARDKGSKLQRNPWSQRHGLAMPSAMASAEAAASGSWQTVSRHRPWQPTHHERLSSRQAVVREHACIPHLPRLRPLRTLASTPPMSMRSGLQLRRRRTCPRPRFKPDRLLPPRHHRCHAATIQWTYQRMPHRRKINRIAAKCRSTLRCHPQRHPP
mmetsp:Transcript_109137/g.319437  ORF Transcript_109137/g.319437 Transcript_109137/m.319437 type:complete len:230 (-) Transcript_109137:693-1382(-)